MQSEDNQDMHMRIAGDEEEIDIDEVEAPEFIQAGEAVEVNIDDDNEPMDDDNDEELETQEVTSTKPVVDLSVARFETHSGPIYAIDSHQNSANGEITIVTGGGDDRAYLHKIAPGRTPESRPLTHEHTDSVSAVRLNLDYVSADLSKTPRFCAVGAYDGSIILYNPDTGEKLKSFEGPTDVECLDFHPKGGTVLLAGSAADNTVWMFHVVLEQCLQVFVGHENAVTSVAFTVDGKAALSASADGTFRVWAPRTGKAKHIFRLGEGAGLTCMATGGGTDRELVIVGGEDGQAHVCHVGSKKVVASLRHFELPPPGPQTDEMELPMSVEAVGFGQSSPNWCATAGVDGNLKVWDLNNDAQCRQTCTIPAPEGETPPGITRLAWHTSKPVVFCSTTDGNIHAWDARNGALLQTLTGHTNVINDLSVLSNSSENGVAAFICAGGDDECVRLFEANN